MCEDEITDCIATTAAECTAKGRCHSVAYPEILLGGGVQQIQLRTEERENGDLGPVAP
jgi:hypothetical protein